MAAWLPALCAPRAAAAAVCSMSCLRRLATDHVDHPGTKTPRYLADNVGAADVELSAAYLAELDALPAPQGGRY